jgi:cytochrome c
MKLHAGARTLGAAVLLLLATTAAFAQGPGPESDKAREAAAMVDRAAALLEERGPAALDEFGRPGSQWMHGDTYLFIDSFDGTILFHAVRPEMEGRNVLDQKDSSGKAFHHVIRDLLRQSDSAWVDYMYPKPGETKMSRKWAYVRKVEFEGQLCWIGSGIYLD